MVVTLEGVLWAVLGILALVVTSVVTGVIYGAFGFRKPTSSPDSLCSRCTHGPAFPACPRPDAAFLDNEAGPDDCRFFSDATAGR